MSDYVMINETDQVGAPPHLSQFARTIRNSRHLSRQTRQVTAQHGAEYFQLFGEKAFDLRVSRPGDAGIQSLRHTSFVNNEAESQ
jgi:hypothetical protein